MLHINLKTTYAAAQLFPQTRLILSLAAWLESISTGAFKQQRVVPSVCFKITGELLILDHFAIVRCKGADRHGMAVIYKYGPMEKV